VNIVRVRLLAGALAVSVSAPAHADDVAKFYAGKSIRLVIGYAPGGGYDLYARTLARHIGRHIPGAPNVVVQNMPSAGSIKAANFLYTVAAPGRHHLWRLFPGCLPRSTAGPRWRCAIRSAEIRLARQHLERGRCLRLSRRRRHPLLR